MLNWISAFATNLSDIMLFPLLGITTVGAAVIIHAFVIREKYDFAHKANTDATWRIHAMTQGLIILWLAFLAIAAVPEPNYETKIVEKVVKQPVNTLIKFDEAYDTCIENQNAKTTKKIINKCEQQALIHTRPDLKMVRVKEKILMKDPYKDLYSNCIQYTGTGPANSKLCHGIATSARKDVIKKAFAQ